MGAAMTSTRICPECGTPNSGLSLFCSECGASLTGALSHPANDPDDQATAAFRPVTDEPVASDPYATQQFRVTAASSPQTTISDVSSASPAGVSATSGTSGSLRPDEGQRGLVLGWIAAILILLVIGYLGWTSFLDPDTRDSIIGIFT